MKNKFVKTLKQFLNENYKIDNLNDNFWKWFGNSKIVDNTNNPLVCYHASPNVFDTFQIKEKKRQSYYGDGFYFSDNPESIYDYGDNVIKCYLSIQKPFILNKNTMQLADKYAESENAILYQNDIEQYCKYTIGYRRGNDCFRENVIKDGYDGLVIEEHHIYIAFHPNQIKSIENNGAWNIDNDNIYL